RPSTYAAIQDTLFKRGYVKKDKGKYVLTDLGRQVVEWARERFPEIADVNFTAKLEEMLDAVELGEESWENVVRQVDSIIKKHGKEIEKVDEYAYKRA
ncbi:MAG: DNA topoisomerase I, partial [Epulopiscium sp.]|nr:DNA topoisomerase I [Candidatus Epulonipiscium sp.]